MLVFSRKEDEWFDVLTPRGEVVSVCVVDIRSDRVRLGVVAPREFPVHRREVVQEIERSGEPMRPGWKHAEEEISKTHPEAGSTGSIQA